jgi:hypothetical protein
MFVASDGLDPARYILETHTIIKCWLGDGNEM